MLGKVRMAEALLGGLHPGKPYTKFACSERLLLLNEQNYGVIQ